MCRREQVENKLSLPGRLSYNLLVLTYLGAHIWLFRVKPQRFLDVEVGLQLLLLGAVSIGRKGQTSGRLKGAMARVFQRRSTEEELVRLERRGAPRFARFLESTRIPRWLLAIAITAFLGGGLAANRILTAGRLIGDETAYAFQGRIFASGHFKAPAPPTAVFFEHHIIDGAGWFVKFPPGWPMVLAVSSKAGVGWAVNILLGAVIAGIVFSIGRRIYSEQEARLALLLLVLSPVFFINCLGQMSHPLCGSLLAGATLFYFRTGEEGALWNAAAMLGAIILAILVRPWTGALFGLVLGGALLWEVRHNRHRLRALLALCLLFAAAAVALCGAYNYETTGAFTKFPYAEFSQTTIPSELVPDVKATARNLRRASISTWAFVFPLLFPAAGFAFFCDREKRREALVLASLFLCLVAGYAPNRYGSGSWAGERFYFEGIFAVALLAARGIFLWEKRSRTGQPTAWFLGSLAAAALVTLGLSLPALFQEVKPYREVRALAGNLRLRNAVVFLKTTDPEFIAKHFNLNEANWPTAPIFFTPDPGPEKRQALAQALGRSKWAVIHYDPVQRRAQLESASASVPPP